MGRDFFGRSFVFSAGGRGGESPPPSMYFQIPPMESRASSKVTSNRTPSFRGAVDVAVAVDPSPPPRWRGGRRGPRRDPRPLPR